MAAPSTEWKERIEPDEEARFEALANIMAGVQAHLANGEKKQRALHAKSHGAFTGTFEVLPELPPEARQGLFREPRSYPVVIRLSNGSARNQHDKTDDVRGIAIKVIGVTGEKAIAALSDAVTQDFLLIQNAAVPFRTPEHFVHTVQAIAGNKFLALPRLVGALGAQLPATLGRLRANTVKAPSSMLDVRFHSALPIRFGAYAAKLDLVPTHPPGNTALDGSREQYAHELEARLGSSSVNWTLRAQFFVDETQTPIEDPTVLWSEEISPFIEVARISVPPQELGSERGRVLQERTEALSFDPWHALAEHRPLGAMMRARNHAYRVSTAARGAAPEPRSLQDVTG
jgi:hypothetical protein